MLTADCEHFDPAFTHFTGEVVVNGVSLPPRVAEELRRLGTPLSWYNAGELQDAVIECDFDDELVADPRGVSFRDKIRLDPGEKPSCGHPGHTEPLSHQDRVRRSRDAGCPEDEESRHGHHHAA